MATETEVRATVDADLKEEAAAIYASAGLTVSEVVRLLLIKTVAERALPFDPFIPNGETVEAMLAARRGDLVRVGGVDDLLADLHADD
jgi:DNA-damage-inducible protein J